MRKHSVQREMSAPSVKALKSTAGDMFAGRCPPASVDVGELRFSESDPGAEIIADAPEGAVGADGQTPCRLSVVR